MGNSLKISIFIDYSVIKFDMSNNKHQNTISLIYRMTDEQMYEKIINRHIKPQININNAYNRQNSNLSK